MMVMREFQLRKGLRLLATANPIDTVVEKDEKMISPNWQKHLESTQTKSPDVTPSLCLKGLVVLDRWVVGADEASFRFVDNQFPFQVFAQRNPLCQTG